MPDPDSNPATYLVLLIFFLLCSAFFSLSEAAVISLNDGKLRRMAESGDKHAKRILFLVDEPSRFLSTIEVGSTLSKLLTAAAAASFYLPLAGLLSFIPLPARGLRFLSLVLISLLLCLLLVVFGEKVPDRKSVV